MFQFINQKISQIMPEMLDRYDYLFKIIVIGDSSVGKTNILLRMTKDEFIADTKPTIGVEFDSKTVDIKNVKVKAHIWDTAGQERYRAITSAYYRGTNGVFLVYDISNRKSFENCLSVWLLQLREHEDNDRKTVIMLVGNKRDLEGQRVVDEDEGKEVAERNGMLFFETSALTREYIEDAFNLLMEKVYERNRVREKETLKKGFKLGDIKGEKLDKNKKKGCC